jgi:hypothetical protein
LQEISDQRFELGDARRLLFAQQLQRGDELGQLLIRGRVVEGRTVVR